MGVRTGYNNKNEIYVTEGNAVRVIMPESAPDIRREPQVTPRKRIRPEDRPVGRPVHHVQEEKSLSMDLPFLLILILAVLSTLVICYNYLNLNASINAHMDNIKSMETRLEKLRTENDALEQSIDNSVDLNYVYQVAVNELGMVHAGSDNVILYDKTESEYVRQYENIPNKPTE
ncbi:MAG: cell division protein FtsL [Eubacteriales bacterium]|nr:cell division protein FtsL [Eubacteriales bacterium]